MPSLSLIMSICYHKSYYYKTPAISWGCSHEVEAYNSSKNVMIQHKADFQLAKSGLIISAEFPFIFKQRDNYISEAAENDNFYLIKTNNNRKLLVMHQYYYQIET